MKARVKSFFGTVLLKLLNDVIFFSPKYFIRQQSGCLILRSRQRAAWKISTGSSWQPEIVLKICSMMRTSLYSLQRNRYFVGKNFWSKKQNRQDRFEEKVQWQHIPALFNKMFKSMIWISPLKWSAYQNVLKKSYQKENQNKLERTE